MELEIDNEVQQDILRDTIIRGIDFSESYEPPVEDEDRDEVIASHRANAAQLRVLLLRLDLLSV